MAKFLPARLSRILTERGRGAPAQVRPDTGLDPLRRADPVPVPDGNDHEHRAYWEQFYRSEASRKVPTEPSPFARWVADREEPPGPLVDLGTGTGRDALWFARRGFRTLGLDYAASAVELASSHATEEGLDAEFGQLNLYHDDELVEMGGRVAQTLRPRLLYARFFVHALEDDARLNLWRLAQILLPHGGRVYLEFRVSETQHAFGEHYRHFVPPEVVEEEIAAAGGSVLERQVGHGMAVYKEEDPRVCRILATWP